MAALGLLPEAYHGWHQIQESLSRLTGLEFALYNEEGAPIGLVSGESPFCRAIRRSGMDGSYCDSQCGSFLKKVIRSDDIQHFKCSSGQNTFAIPIVHGSSRLVIAGGKTFQNREDYKKALTLIKGSGKVSVTGRHKYRYIGKRRMREVISLAANAAHQHFQTSHQKFSYQLKHNRQAALLENISLLYEEKGQAELALNLLHSVTALFEAETASLQIYGKSSEAPEEHYIHGSGEDVVSAAGAQFEKELAKMLRDSGEGLFTGQREIISRLNLPEEVHYVVSIPFIFRGGGDRSGPVPDRRGLSRLAGALTLFNTELGPEDLLTLRTYVQQTAAIIENKRLRGEVKEKIDDLGRLIGAGLNLEPLLDRDDVIRCIFDKSTELLQAERGSLMLLNEKSEELIVKVSKGLSEDVSRDIRLKAGEGIAGKVVSAGAPIMAEDMESDLRLLLKKRPEYKTKSFISLPLKAEGRIIGVLNISDKISGKVFNREDLELVQGFAAQASVALERAILHSRVEGLRKVLIKDPLTGLLNRRYFSERLTDELERSKRYGHRLSLMVIEVEDFEAYRERHGYYAGEEALVKIAGILGSSLRANDILARYGDRHFALVLPETGTDRAAKTADRITRKVKSSRFPTGEDKEEGRLFIRTGISGFPEDGEALNPLYEKAYRAMSRPPDEKEEPAATR
ncbi:MAG: diguanylate cyclase [Nitrospirota bacterium]